MTDTQEAAISIPKLALPNIGGWRWSDMHDAACRMGGWKWAAEEEQAFALQIPNLLSGLNLGGWRWANEPQQAALLTRLLGGWRWSEHDDPVESLTGHIVEGAASIIPTLNLPKINLGGWRWATDPNIASKLVQSLLGGWRWGAVPPRRPDDHEDDEDHELERPHPRPEYAADVITELDALPKASSPADLIAAGPQMNDVDLSTIGIRFYFKEGEASVDKRTIDPNAINFSRRPPLPIMLQRVKPAEGGHAGSELAGVVDRVGRDGLVIIGEGRLASNEPGQALFWMAADRILQTWSPDMGNAITDVEINATDEDGQPEDLLTHLVSATLIGFTVVPMPALDSAVFELFDISTGEVVVPAPQRSGPSVGDAMSPPTQHVDDMPIEQEMGMLTVNGEGQLVYGFVASADTTFDPELELQPLALVAHAAPTAPPREFFEKPELNKLQRWSHVDDETGRVYGHAAGFDECHIGYPDRCVTIREVADCRGEGSFEYAMPGHVVCADGTKVATGPLPVKGGHAQRGVGYQQAMSHYDDPAAVVADVAYGMDEFGIWYSGYLRPGASPANVAALRASGVSMDAREIGGKLRYLATCCVNTPGFPKVSVRLAASADGGEEVVELIAAGGAPVENCGCPDCTDCHPKSDCPSCADTSEIEAELRSLREVVTADGAIDRHLDRLRDDVLETLVTDVG